MKRWTDLQLIAAVESYKHHASQRRAAKAIGISQTNFHFRIREAARRGFQVPNIMPAFKESNMKSKNGRKPMPDQVLRNTIETLSKFGTKTRAAEIMGISTSALASRIEAAKKRGLIPGYEPPVSPIHSPPPLRAETDFDARKIILETFPPSTLPESRPFRYLAGIRKLGWTKFTITFFPDETSTLSVDEVPGPMRAD